MHGRMPLQAVQADKPTLMSAEAAYPARPELPCSAALQAC